MEGRVLLCVVTAPLKAFPESLDFPLWSCSSLASQIQRLKDEFLVKIIIKDKIFRDCLSAVAVAVKWPFLHRRRSLWMRQELKGNLVCKLKGKLVCWSRGRGSWKQGTGVLSRAAVNPQSLTGYPGKGGICPDVLPWNTEVLCFGCRCWGRFSYFKV